MARTARLEAICTASRTRASLVSTEADAGMSSTSAALESEQVAPSAGMTASRAAPSALEVEESTFLSHAQEATGASTSGMRAFVVRAGTGLPCKRKFCCVGRTDPTKDDAACASQGGATLLWAPASTCGAADGDREAVVLTVLFAECILWPEAGRAPGAAAEEPMTRRPESC